jgi:hypothetical protein
MSRLACIFDEKKGGTMRVQSSFYSFLFIGLFILTNASDNAAQLKERSKTPLDGRGGGIIAFYSEKRDTHRNAEIYVMNADGSNQTRLTNHQGNDYWPCWALFHSDNK